MRISVLALLLCFAVLAACGGSDGTTDPPDGPTKGTIAVAATTTGDDQDTNGYSVMLDGTEMAAIGSNGAVNLTSVNQGSRSVSLSGVADNCAVGGQHPRSVSVTAGATAQAPFDVSCVAAVGSIEVSVTTTGQGTDSDGYLVSVDGGAGTVIDANGSVTLEAVAAGARQLELGGISSNCQVTSANPVTADLPTGGQVSVTFSVSCDAPPTGKIAFLSWRDGSADGDTIEVYVMNGAGGGVTRVTEMADIKWAPTARLSPDGTQILFAAGDPSNLWVVNTDGTGLLKLTDFSEAALDHDDAAWSPDGTRIAYEGGGLWTTSLDGSGKTLLSDLGAGDISWSPNGSQVAFTAFDVCCDVYIWVVNADGTGLQRLSDQIVSGQAAQWSPDGAHIAYIRYANVIPSIWVMNADGSEPTLVAEDAWRLAWSPDGSLIAFAGQGLETVRPDGTDRRQVIDMVIDPSNGYPYWSPDGSTIAFVSFPNGVLFEPRDVYTIRPDGTGLTNITNHPAADEIGSWGP